MDDRAPLDAPAGARAPPVNDRLRRTTVAELSSRLRDVQTILADLLDQMERVERDRYPAPWVELVLGKRAGLKANAVLMDRIRDTLSRARQVRGATYPVERAGGQPGEPLAHVLLLYPPTDEWAADLDKATVRRIASSRAPAYLVLVAPPGRFDELDLATPFRVELPPALVLLDPRDPQNLDYERTAPAPLIDQIDAIQRRWDAAEAARVRYGEAARALRRV